MPSALPDRDTAYQTLFDGVHQRVFFHHLGQIRPEYMPTNEKRASALLQLAGKLRLADQEDLLKQADAAEDPVIAANAALDDVMSQAGYGSVREAAAQDELMAIKQAAADLAQDPDLYNAVLALKADAAEQHLARLQGR